MLKQFRTNDDLMRAEAYIALTCLSTSEIKPRLTPGTGPRKGNQNPQIEYLTTTLGSLKRAQALLNREKDRETNKEPEFIGLCGDLRDVLEQLMKIPLS